MPAINYSNAQIYKISRSDGDTEHEYYGSTCNLRARKCNHKSITHNANNPKYNVKLYTHMRANGGWQNWNLIWLEDYPCLTKKELLLRERHWIETKKPTLNMNMPGRDQLEVNKLWKSVNQDKIKQYRINAQVKVKCECGSTIQKAEMARHRKTKRHTNFINDIAKNILPKI